MGGRQKTTIFMGLEEKKSEEEKSKTETKGSKKEEKSKKR